MRLLVYLLGIQVDVIVGSSSLKEAWIWMDMYYGV